MCILLCCYFPNFFFHQFYIEVGAPIMEQLNNIKKSMIYMLFNSVLCTSCLFQGILHPSYIIKCSGKCFNSEISPPLLRCFTLMFYHVNNTVQISLISEYRIYGIMVIIYCLCYINLIRTKQHLIFIIINKHDTFQL